jgi:hypothetical protein
VPKPLLAANHSNEGEHVETLPLPLPGQPEGGDEAAAVSDALARMRIRASDAATADALLELLESRCDATVERVNDHELQVSLLGSYHEDAVRMELYLRIRAWEAARSAAGVHVEITSCGGPKVASSGCGLQRDLVTGPLEVRDEAAGGVFWLAAAVVVAAELALRGGSKLRGADQASGQDQAPMSSCARTGAWCSWRPLDLRDEGT